VTHVIVSALLIGLLGGGAPERGQHDDLPAPTAAEDAETGILDFRIVDPEGRPIPARLTFIGADGPGAKLFPNADAQPADLAVRANVVYCGSGTGRITVPAGTYTVYASHGLEWSIDSFDLALQPGDEAEWTARLVHEVDTTGWVSGDFHLHTLTYSGHGDSNMNERIISLLGEGVEFAVATDHNHHTDYGPTIESLGADGSITAVTGNEISTPIGHFNAFPLDPSQSPVDHKLRNAETLFKLIRQHETEFGVVPVIQINHPRLGSIDYFGKAALDPVTVDSDPDVYSADFDSIEVFNGNAGWGYYDADLQPPELAGAGLHSILRDWFNLLNRGHRHAAVGNSDSHHVYAIYAGYPRNYTRSTTDEPSGIDPAEVAAAIRSKSVFTTIGPFVEFEIDGHPMGSTFSAAGGRVDLHVRVQAASWVDCDRVKVVVNGGVADVIDVPPIREALRLDRTIEVALTADSWIALLVEGDEPMAPIVHDTGRPVRPLAVTNPVWVDVDGDGAWTPPWDAALARVAQHRGDVDALMRKYEGSAPVERGLLVLAAGHLPESDARPIVERGLADSDRGVRLCAARAAQRLRLGGLTPLFLEIIADSGTDAYLGVAALRALEATDRARFHAHLAAFVDRFGSQAGGRYRLELNALLPGEFVDDWLIAGYFPNATADALVTSRYRPETDPAPSATFTVKQADTAGWKRVAAGRGGFVDLCEIDDRRPMYENAIAYAQTWLYAPRDKTVLYTLGTDDGCQLFVNGNLVYTDNTRHGASPVQHIGRLVLPEGWSRVLIKVENGRHHFGLYFRVLDPEVIYSAEPPA
jgi:hypothetical protein